MKANFDFNRLSESRKQELDRMVADFSEAGCLFVEDLFLEFLIDADNGIDRSDDKLVATFDDECGHELVFILSQEEVHYVIHAISENWIISYAKAALPSVRMKTKRVLSASRR